MVVLFGNMRRDTRFYFFRNICFIIYLWIRIFFWILGIVCEKYSNKYKGFI